jgi:ribosomal-protein-alanine N-acetyltransferase
MPRMGSQPQLRTERLLLRPWRVKDREPFAAMNADPAVMEYFPVTLSREKSDALAQRIESDIERLGYGFWAAEVPGEAPFIGFVGIDEVDDYMTFAPGIEIGWRLAREHWGKGYASEGARATADFSFGELGLEQIVALTAAGNVRSRRVMERLGMRRDPAEDFLHPTLAADHPIAPHVLYRLTAQMLP